METKNINGRTIAGIIILLIGAVLLLDNLDWIQVPVRHYLISWKTLLIGIGILLMATKENYTTGIFMIGLGLILWLPEIFDHQFTLREIFWPALLIVFGILLLVKAAIPHKNKHAGPRKDSVCKAEIVSHSATEKTQ